MYDLNDPPIFAPLKAHAAAITDNLFRVHVRSFERWPVDMPVVLHKRQPRVDHMWAAALARLPEDARESALAELPEKFAETVRPLIPAAQEAWRSRGVAA